ncbi:hypothetical protein SDC9_49224 [bioreactor metagenome]|uniref:Uncharacterized protein n=1 Tax=bioreactor metagenome TaxID=1076179 RepID=A0A644WGG0_9ZZZZ
MEGNDLAHVPCPEGHLGPPRPGFHKEEGRSGPGGHVQPLRRCRGGEGKVDEPVAPSRHLHLPEGSGIPSCRRGAEVHVLVEEGVEIG